MDRVVQRSGGVAWWTVPRAQQVSLAVFVIGALGAFLLLLGGGGAGRAAMIVLVGTAFAWVAPDVIGRLLLSRARMREIEESIQLLRTLEVYLQNGHTLRSALEASSQSLILLGPRIRQALSIWGQGPYRAIDSLESSTSDESVRLVITALKQAVDLGPGQLPVFLERENEAIRRSMEALNKANQARKPIIFTIYLGLPILGYMTAFIMPFGTMVAHSITNIGGIL